METAGSLKGGYQMQLLETVRSLLGLHVPVSPAMLRAPAGPSLLSPTALPEDDDPNGRQRGSVLPKHCGAKASCFLAAMTRHCG